MKQINTILYRIGYVFSKPICFLLLLLGVVKLSSCKKYLDLPSSQSLAIPHTFDDVEALTDGYRTGIELSEIVADDYFISSSSWNTIYSNQTSSVNQQAQNYIWNGRSLSIDPWWDQGYSSIYYFNLALEILPKIEIDPGNETRWRTAKGMAHFKRALVYFSLSQLYCKPYTSTASTDLGLPLRVKAEIAEKSVRSTLQQTYDFIISDFIAASDYLPETSLYPTRPTKAAAFASLARIYLSMRNYSLAGSFADSALIRSSFLLDYNTISSFSDKPFAMFNAEILYPEEGSGTSILSLSHCRIDSILYNSYHNDDLRKNLFFKANGNYFTYKGSYGVTANRTFPGTTTAEMYLIRAEANARSGNASAALNSLNLLMQKRWKASTWSPITAVDAVDALNKILVERRKELIFRCLRWSDLRRFNLEGYNITLKRVVNGTDYLLPPNDLKWVMLIPQNVIDYSGMQQNPR